MTDIWIDPAELDAMATVISQQGQRAQEAFAGDLGLRDVDLPAHLGWVREEAAELAQEAALSTLVYLLLAIDLGIRSGAITVDQAAPTAVAAPGAVPNEGFVLSGSPQIDPAVAATLAAGAGVGGGGFVLDQMLGPDGLPRTGSGGIDFNALNRLAQGNAGASLSMPDVGNGAVPYLAGRNESFDPATGRNVFDPEKFHTNKLYEEQAIEKQRLRNELDGP